MSLSTGRVGLRRHVKRKGKGRPGALWVVGWVGWGRGGMSFGSICSSTGRLGKSAGSVWFRVSQGEGGVGR